ncbi:MAG TPA: hypothetical protein VMC79_06680, partial [Rectinemataceae bacterium]|nr:hypothetical protein [Rectinemataceae bacterium]
MRQAGRDRSLIACGSGRGSGRGAGRGAGRRSPRRAQRRYLLPVADYEISFAPRMSEIEAEEWDSLAR